MIAPPPRATEPALPETDLDEEALLALIPPYRVILHNDEHNTMDHVVESLVRCVPSLTVEAAAAIMIEAHNEGKATVIECPKEAAEHYRGALESCGLTATIEPV
ncbi:MAG: ATP-dependent Clp protease adaptor ClpS [Dehalococcoidia bacterium]|nr:ATP-dependent Clp protease adaptor ClpS [Dehalococcoidia bacterium]MYA51969.1 ATP-dependent Clp protease adaptor ClpS [Dehalococcoidia bacterium]